ncbi:MAG TPA: methyltransferase domain-containing protein [Blastocatellia bacterium]|nr:methyltransferase domain-containing protein [Blastocatellia bacterium]
MNNDREKELAYRYELFITPDWRDRFDTLINEHVELPAEGQFLDVNCGTGAYAIELAERVQGKGEVIGTDPSAERLELARAKALVKKIEEVSFEQAAATDLPFRDEQFDAVIGDASFVAPDQMEDMLTEMARVASPGARIVFKMTTHGSFDEFFSIYWEALLLAGIVEEVWGALETLINERGAKTDAERLAERVGLRQVESVTSKESFLFDSGSEFMESPLIKDTALDEWLSIVPEAKRPEVYERIISLIDRERHEGPFEVSIKATVVMGKK